MSIIGAFQWSLSYYSISLDGLLLGLASGRFGIFGFCDNMGLARTCGSGGLTPLDQLGHQQLHHLRKSWSSQPKTEPSSTTTSWRASQSAAASPSPIIWTSVSE